jgi:hydroxymethylbilane synthase
LTASKKLRVATRGSVLALAQTRQLVEQLRGANPAVHFEVVTFATTGDRITDRPLSQFRGMGVFVKELEAALLSGSADLAVHSLKDVPIACAKGLSLATFPVRNNPFDLCLGRSGRCFADLPPGAVVGTSSPRRLVQLRAQRPDLVFKDLRGNVDTRLRKLDAGNYDAIIVAAAGMLRLGKPFDPAALLPPEICLPAAGQGCLVLECREDDVDALGVAAKVDDAMTRLAVSAERDFLGAIGGGCRTPAAVYAKNRGQQLTLWAMIGDPDTAKIARDKLTVDSGAGTTAGSALAGRIVALCKETGISLA